MFAAIEKKRSIRCSSDCPIRERIVVYKRRKKMERRGFL